MNKSHSRKVRHGPGFATDSTLKSPQRPKPTSKAPKPSKGPATHVKQVPSKTKPRWIGHSDKP